ncbi:MAG: 3-phosphoshikimate 1-carboxyvinyltransferase [Deltaproteobacteria bacterium]|nr:3-phosphoshikimate 1-carboxyvinyltransferase [Deltaproteobacteria bacterium]
MYLSPQQCLHGDFYVPGDKSLSHRALVVGAFSDEESHVSNLNDGSDISTTIQVLRTIGVFIERDHDIVKIRGGKNKFLKFSGEIHCGNSGTTLSLLLGLSDKTVTFTGDESLQSRSFVDQIQVLESIGFRFSYFKKKYHLPFSILYHPNLDNGLEADRTRFSVIKASAQLKSTLLLVHAIRGRNIHIEEKYPTRNHTENFLKLTNSPSLKPLKYTIPGDFSSAAFITTAALLAEESNVTIHDVLLNPTRTRFLNIMADMGACISWKIDQTGLEPIGSISVRSSKKLSGLSIGEEDTASLIDEIPCLAMLALKAHGTTSIRGAARLRNKECDRICAIVQNIKSIGGQIREYEDGFDIQGGIPLSQPKQSLNGYQDHRIIMALSVLRYYVPFDLNISDASWVSISYPSFFQDVVGLKS